MAKQKKVINPFYVLLLVVGVAFVITACAYGVMAVKMLDPVEVTEDARSSRDFVTFFDQHGMTLLLAEIGALAVLTFAAIATDDYWQRRAAQPPDA